VLRRQRRASLNSHRECQAVAKARVVSAARTQRDALRRLRSVCGPIQRLCPSSATLRNRGMQHDRHELLTDGTYTFCIVQGIIAQRQRAARAMPFAGRAIKLLLALSYRSSSASLNMPGFLAAELSGLTGEESSVARVCWKESGRESLVVSRRLAFPCKPFRSYDCVAYPRCGYWK
jgi:hypothetical protein